MFYFPKKWENRARKSKIIIEAYRMRYVAVEYYAKEFGVMSDSKRVVLRSTSNTELTRLIGREGDLSIGKDGLFRFQFMDDNGQVRTLRSGIQGQLGSLDLPASKEVCFQTKNSVYVFEKTEREMGLFSYEHNEMDSPATISYEDYNALRTTVDKLRRGDNQRLTLQEQTVVRQKWEKVNKDIHDGKTTILPPERRETVGMDR